MSGQGKTRPGLIDTTQDRQSVLRSINEMIDDQLRLGNSRLDIYLSRAKRRELIREIKMSTIVLPISATAGGMQAFEEYRGCRIIILPDGSDVDIYVVAWGKDA